MKHQSTNEEFYLKFGLSKDPFPVDSLDDVFFITPELNHRVELVKHLLEFSQQLLIITAEKDSGKSALFQYLYNHIKDNWSVSYIIAGNEMDNVNLAGEILRGIFEEDDTGNEDAVDRLNEYLVYCDRNHTLPVVLIDEAHLLSVDVLEFVLKLNKLSANNTKFRFVLFGQESLNDSLEDPRVKILTAGILHHISLPSFTKDQVSAYVEYRICACGQITEYPFTEKDMNHIYKVSGGIPGKINLLARQAMQDPVERSSHRDRFQSPLKIIINPIFMGMLVTLIIAGYLFFSDTTDDTTSEQISINLPPEQALPLANSRQQDLPEQTPEDIVIDGANAADTGTDTTDEAPVEADESIAAVMTETGEDLVISKPLSPQEVLAESPATDSTTRPAPVVEAEQEKVAVNPLLGSGIFSGLKGADWLHQQSPEQYVLQLIGARDIKTLEAFLQGQNQLRDKLAVFSTINAGKPWYVLVYGIYPDRAAALAELKRLPGRVKAQKPWPRPMASIQLDIEMKP